MMKLTVGQTLQGNYDEIDDEIDSGSNVTGQL